MHEYDTHNKIVQIAADQDAIYCIHLDQQGLGISVLNLELRLSEQKFFQKQFATRNGVAPLITDNILYIFAQGGQIIVLDKYSLQVERVIDVGAMEILSASIDNGRMYVACGVPIRYNKELKISNTVFCLIDLEQGTKTLQSQIYPGKFTSMCCLNGIVGLLDNNLVQLNTELSQIQQNNLPMKEYWPPVMTDLYIVCTTPLGTLEMIERETGRVMARTLLDKHLGNPVVYKDKFASWGYNGLHLYDPSTMTCHLDQKSLTSVYAISNGRYVAGINGDEIIIYDGHSLGSIKSHASLINPVISGDVFITHNGKKIYAELYTKSQ